VHLSWNAPETPVTAYHVYPAAAPGGPYQRINATAVRTTSFVHANAPAGGTYQVRAVKLQTCNGGTYMNGSQGLFVAGP
jgi:hypothetical protein